MKYGCVQDTNACVMHHDNKYFTCDNSQGPSYSCVAKLHFKLVGKKWRLDHIIIIDLLHEILYTISIRICMVMIMIM